MRIVLVVERKEDVHSFGGFLERVELIRPDDLLLERTHEALGVGISFWIVVARGHVRDPERFEFFLITVARGL